MGGVIHTKTISELHRLYDLPPAPNKLISVIPHEKIAHKVCTETDHITDLYCIAFVDGIRCSLGYGDGTYDFKSGTMLFTLPGQNLNPSSLEILSDIAGWSILFHPNLLIKSDLGVKIDQYTFFNYEVNEALSITPEEASIINEIRMQIDHEAHSDSDRHTEVILRAKLELILSYCARFYDRQYHDSCRLERDYVRQFDMVLNSYYKGGKQSELGVPTVQYCGHQLGISPYYLSNILKRETGMSALECIHNFLIEKAKDLIAENNLTISQIAYNIGFEYPQHFSRLFKSKTGMSPRSFKLTLKN